MANQKCSSEASARTPETQGGHVQPPCISEDLPNITGTHSQSELSARVRYLEILAESTFTEKESYEINGIRCKGSIFCPQKNGAMEGWISLPVLKTQWVLFICRFGIQFDQLWVPNLHMGGPREDLSAVTGSPFQDLQEAFRGLEGPPHNTSRCHWKAPLVMSGGPTEP